MIIDVDSHHYETGSYKEIFDYIEDPVMRDKFIYTKGQHAASALDRRLSGDGRAASRATSTAPPSRRRARRIATSG